MPECNAKQADFIVGADVLANPKGTAPGFRVRKDGVEIVILPGVPSEMKEIFETLVLPVLRERAGGKIARRRVLRIAGMFASTRGPATNPVCAATKSSAPAEISVRATRTGPMRSPPMAQSAKTRSA